MFYQVGDGHGLPHDPFKAIVTPRPIGWISTVSSAGKSNLAPYSFFNAICAHPPMVMFSSDGRKDSLINAEETGEFACNFVSEGLLKTMSDTSSSLDYGTSEFEAFGVDALPCQTIAAPRVAEAFSVLECKVTKVLQLEAASGAATQSWMVIGEVMAVHIDDSVLTDGRFDLTKAKPAARLGYRDYTVVSDIFELARPGQAASSKP